MPSLTSLITAEAYRDHAAFWKETLGTFADDFVFRQPWLSLPEDPAAVCEETITLSADAEQRIRALAAGSPLALFAVIVSAAAVVIRAHAGTTQVAIDAPPLPGVGDEPSVDQAIPLVLAVDQDRSLRAHVSAVADVVARSYSFQQLPIAQASELLLGRPRARTNVRARLDALHGSTGFDNDYAFEIVASDAPGLPIAIRGRGPACSAAFAHLVGRHLRRALEEYADLAPAVRDIDLMGSEERRRLLVAYNDTAAAMPAETIGELFAAQAAASSASSAIELDGIAVDYATLDAQSNQLARALQTDYGISPGEVVGVLVHRSPLTVAAILGVLKAGAVYLPIDPGYPEERLRFMVSDAGVRVLLVHAEHFDRLGALYETPMFALDLQLPTLEHASDPVPPVCKADDPAYIIYTSGSTGQPKAVVLAHRGFVNMVRHHIEAFGVDASDRLLQFYNLSFDSSLFEVFVALLSGATLVMTARETIDDPAALSASIARAGVTSLTLPPIYQSALDPACLSSVRRFVSAGDACKVDDAVAFARHAKYFNSYGPTECSVCVTHFEVRPDGRYGSRIPIGRPISNTSIYLLDDALRPVAEGVVGEICVGGVSLAQGYLNRAELTAAAFVPSPFATSGRLYRTGDLGVWRPDGELELIGRKDNQVKVRGYRIELGEIEAVLLQVEGVREAAVVAREDGGTHKRLVAYVTADRQVDAAQLRAALQARMPDYMVPALFVVLDAMPVTANGKIDRKALPLPATGGATAAPAEPTTGMQAKLLDVWREVLGQPGIGIHDNLFELGGDSIIAIQIASRARQAGVKLAPNQLFEHQTVAALAEVAIDAAPLAADEGALEGECPLGPMQEWFFERAPADPHHFNQSVWIDIEARLPGDAVAQATRAVLEHHDALRLRFRQVDGRWTGEYGSVPDAPPFTVVDLAGVGAADQSARMQSAADAASASLDLAAGPLLRVVLFDRGAGVPSRLFVAVHHLAVDGVSWRLLLEDFRTSCEQAVRGEAVDLPPKTTSYRTWARRLREDAAAAAGELDYWLALRHTTAASLPVESDVAGPQAVATSRDVTRTLDAATTAALLTDTTRTYLMDAGEVLLTALARTLAAWSGGDVVLVDVEAHGRDSVADDEVDTSRTVGWFTSQYPVLLHVDPQAPAVDAVKTIKEQLRAVPRRGAGFGVLRYAAASPAAEQMRSLPQAPVLFNYVGQGPRGTEAERGWRIVPGMRAADVSPRAARPHLLDVNAIVAGGTLEISWGFSHVVFRPETIEQLADRYERELRVLIDEARGAAAPQYTPSDFPAAGLSQQALDALVAKLSKP